MSGSSLYPGSLDTFEVQQNKTDTQPGTLVHAEDINKLADAISSIESELGVNPSGSVATVANRLTGLAPKDSPALTGTPTAPTPLASDDSTRIATTAFVKAAVGEAGGGTVMEVGATAPITSTGGASPTIGISPATQSAAGSMSAADKTKLDGATNTATPNTLVSRDASGDAAVAHLTVGNPTADTHAIGKGYADGRYAPTVHTHTGYATESAVTTLQTQVTSIGSEVDGKQDAITGAATSIASSDLATDLVLVSDGSGKVAVSTVSGTVLGYLASVTSDIQTQLNAKLDASDDIDGGTF